MTTTSCATLRRPKAAFCLLLSRAARQGLALAVLVLSGLCAASVPVSAQQSTLDPFTLSGEVRFGLNACPGSGETDPRGPINELRGLTVTDTNVPGQVISSAYALVTGDDPATAVANDALYTMEVQRDVDGVLVDYDFSRPSIIYGPNHWSLYGPFAPPFTSPATGDLVVDYIQEQAVSVIVTIESLTPGADINTVSASAYATDGSGFQARFGTARNGQGPGSDPVGLGSFTSTVDSLGRETVKAEFLTEPGHPYHIFADVTYVGVGTLVPVPVTVDLPAADFGPCDTVQVTLQVEKPPTGTIEWDAHLIADPADVAGGVGPRATGYRMVFGGVELDGTAVPGPIYSTLGASNGVSPAAFQKSGLPLGAYSPLRWSGYHLVLGWPDRATTMSDHRGVFSQMFIWPISGQVYSPYDAGDNQTFGVDRNGEIILTTDDPVAGNGDVLESITIRGEMAYLDSGIDLSGCATSAIIESGTAQIFGASLTGDTYLNELGIERTASLGTTDAISRGLFKNDGSGDYEVVLLDGEWIESRYSLHLLDDQGSDVALQLDFDGLRTFDLVSGRANQLNPARRALALGKVTVRMTVENTDGSLRPFRDGQLVIPAPAHERWRTQAFDNGNGTSGFYRIDARSADVQNQEHFVTVYAPAGSEADIAVSALVPENDDGTGVESRAGFGDLLDVPFIAGPDDCGEVCVDSASGGVFVDDGDSPSITVAAVPSITSADNVDLVGTADDAAPIVELRVDGVAQPVDGAAGTAPFSEAFSDNVALALGTNTISITATDLCGHTTTVEVVIVRVREPQIQLDAITQCTADGTLPVSGSVDSDVDVARIFYRLGSGPEVDVCPGACGIDPSFSTTAALSACDNQLTVTAVDVLGNEASETSIVTFDAQPPVLSGCEAIEVEIEPGDTGAAVSFDVTATDDCSGPVSVACDLPSGSFFPEGETLVTCTAADTCGGDGQCSFPVTVSSCQPVPPDVRTQGFWKRQCRGPHPSGEPDNLPDYVDLVNDYQIFSAVTDVPALCDRLEPRPRNDKCEKAEAQLMAAALNVASGRLAVCNCIDDPVHPGATVGEVLADLDALLADPSRSAGDCNRVKSIADRINRGESDCDSDSGDSDSGDSDSDSGDSDSGDSDSGDSDSGGDSGGDSDSDSGGDSDSDSGGDSDSDSGGDSDSDSGDSDSD